MELPENKSIANWESKLSVNCFPIVGPANWKPYIAICIESIVGYVIAKFLEKSAANVYLLLTKHILRSKVFFRGIKDPCLSMSPNKTYAKKVANNSLVLGKVTVDSNSSPKKVLAMFFQYLPGCPNNKADGCWLGILALPQLDCNDSSVGPHAHRHHPQTLLHTLGQHATTLIPPDKPVSAWLVNRLTNPADQNAKDKPSKREEEGDSSLHVHTAAARLLLCASLAAAAIRNDGLPFYSRFPDNADGGSIVDHLNKLLRKNAPWKWTETKQKTFDILKCKSRVSIRIQLRSLEPTEY
ncbi:hypothetical protein VTP01DRAFT_9186 [Rhizomucor pusillus]|uniref:uncharacterized protein n=1 Tax=Rhizomucor pusillus TaxID=4840 RepID=UPI0037445749